jgi:hypothetical protein
MQKNNSILNLINENTVSFDKGGLIKTRHPVSTKLLVGDPSKSIGEVELLQWSPNKDYAQVKHTITNDITWVHRTQLFVLDVLSNVDVAGNPLHSEDIDIEALADKWSESMGPFSEPSSMSSFAHMGTLTGRGVSGIEAFDINKNKVNPDVDTTDAGKDIPNSIERASHMGPQVIEGTFPNLSDDEVAIHVGETGNVIRIVTKVKQEHIHTGRELMVKLNDEGQLLITDVPSKDGVKAEVSDDAPVPAHVNDSDTTEEQEY